MTRIERRVGNMKTVLGFILGILIGVTCRFFDVPAPAPPKIVGALLVVSMTVGYLAADKLLATRSKETTGASVGLTYSAKTPDKR
jgi:XapX domain-containing protein